MNCLFYFQFEQMQYFHVLPYCFKAIRNIFLCWLCIELESDAEAMLHSSEVINQKNEICRLETRHTNRQKEQNAKQNRDAIKRKPEQNKKINKSRGKKQRKQTALKKATTKNNTKIHLK